jgi:WD40 repeat protein
MTDVVQSNWKAWVLVSQTVPTKDLLAVRKVCLLLRECADTAFYTHAKGLINEDWELWMQLRYFLCGSRVRHRFNSSVHTVSYTHDGSRIVCGKSCSISKLTVLDPRYYDSKHAPPPKRLPGHDHEVYSIACSSDGATVASGGYDGYVRVWDPRKRKQNLLFSLIDPQDHPASFFRKVTSVAFNPGGTEVVSVKGGKKIQRWCLKSRSLVASIPLLTLPLRYSVKTVQYSPDGSFMAATGGQPGPSDSDYNGELTFIACNPDPLLAGQVFAYHTKNLRAEVTSAKFSSDGTIFVTSDNFIRALKVSSAPPPLGFKVQDLFMTECLPQGAITECLALNRDGTLLVVGGSNGTIRFFEYSTAMGFVFLLEDTHCQVTSLAFNHDGTEVVSGGKDSTVRVWNLKILCLLKGKDFESIGTLGSDDFSSEFSI